MDATTGNNEEDQTLALILNGQAEQDEDEDVGVEGDEDADTRTLEADEDADGGDGEQDDGDPDDADDDDADGDDDEDGDADQNDTLHTVMVDGKPVQVTLSELTRSYSGQAYIQKRMQETANVFRALQSERQALASLGQVLQSGNIPLEPPKPPSAELAQRDPFGYVAAQAKYAEDMRAFEGAMQAAQQAAQTQRATEMAMRNAYLQEQLEKAVREIPELGDKRAGRALRQRMVQIGTEAYGFTEDEIMSVGDARVIRLLHDAIQYRALRSGQKQRRAQGAKEPPPVVMKPGNAVPVPKKGAVKAAAREKARAKMRRSGSVDDVASFLLTG